MKTRVLKKNYLKLYIDIFTLFINKKILNSFFITSIFFLYCLGIPKFYIKLIEILKVILNSY